MSLVLNSAGPRPGLLIAIGGAEDKVHDRQLLRRFVAEAGGSRAKIAIFPTASQLDDIGVQYARLFQALDAGETNVISIRDREQALHDAGKTIEVLDRATGIFISGGNQLRLSTILGGTQIAHRLRSRHAAGAVVAGTSAGASLLSEHMIAFGQSGPAPAHGMVTLAPGLGLTNRVIIDQHFRQRDRLGRLLTALAYNPVMVGLGVDEDTAAFIDSGNVVHVVGSGSVTVVDAAGCTWTNAHGETGEGPLAMLGVTMHLLTAGCRYDLESRRASPPENE